MILILSVYYYVRSVILMLKTLFVLSYVFTFLAQYCDIRYDYHIKTMYGWSLAPVACKRDHVLFVLSYIFTFLSQYFEVSYDVYIKLMFYSSLFVGGLMSYISYLCFLFVQRGVQHILTIMSNMMGVLNEAGTAYPLRAPGFTRVFGGVCVANLFSFLC